MANLHCSSNNCAFNNSGSCYASNIKIEGFDAKVTPETYCDTYRDGQISGFLNNTDSASLTSTQNISCSASNCKYNCYGGCNASHVDIDINNNSCETFSM